LEVETKQPDTGLTQTNEGQTDFSISGYDVKFRVGNFVDKDGNRLRTKALSPSLSVDSGVYDPDIVFISKVSSGGSFTPLSMSSTHSSGLVCAFGSSGSLLDRHIRHCGDRCDRCDSHIRASGVIAILGLLV
jgi:hypothetical protein